MNRKTIYSLIGIVVLGSAGYLLGARFLKGSITNHANASIQVVAAENFWGDITKQIGGNHVNVTSIISDPSADPHLYESDARDAAAIDSANIVIENGLGYDDFMDKLLAASPNGSRQILSAANVLNASNGANPHLWYDIPRVPEMAGQIEAALVEKDPAHTNDYRANLKTFDDSLKPIIDAINTIKSHYPSTPVAYTERVPGYLLANAGLSVKTPSGFAQSIEDGNEPSSADTLAMEQLINERQIKVLLYNSQATSPVSQHIRDLANTASIPVIGVTETLPKSEKSYQSWQLDQVNALLSALGKK